MATASRSVIKAKSKTATKPRTRKSKASKTAARKKAPTSKKAARKKPAAKVLKLDPKAAFMGKKHQNYFRQKLLDWKADLERDLEHGREELKFSSINEPDANDRASSERDWSVEMRRRDRQRKLIRKIDAALARLEDGEYGYCSVTGEPIALARLDARPIATMTIEAQEAHEREEQQKRDV